MICLLVPLVLLFTRSSSKAAMWSKPLNSTLFGSTPQLYRWLAEKERKNVSTESFSLSISYLNSTETARLDFCASTLGKTRIFTKKTRTRLRTKWPSFSSRRLQSFPNERDEILMNLFARPTRFSSVDAVGFSVTPSSSGRVDSLCSRWGLRKAFAIPGDMQAETLSDCSGRVSKVEIYILQEVLGPSGLRRPPSLLIVCLLVASVLAILLTSSFGLFGHSSRFIDATVIG